METNVYIATSPETLICKQTYLHLQEIFQASVYLKYEGFNAAGSIKLKTAANMMSTLEAEGRLKPGSRIVESSSGNLGVALSIICASKGYEFICVTDPISTKNARNMIRATGGKVVMVNKRDENGGYLQTRLNKIQEMLKDDANLLWVNQYANEANWQAHYKTTAPEILSSFDKVDWLFIGAGTTGTLMGCIRYFAKHSPTTKIIAVDAIGSITFGGPKGKRLIPGLGTSRVPPICEQSRIENLIMINEKETIGECHHWAKKGFVFGGSTGSVLSAIKQCREDFRPDDTVVGISPDGGEKYLDTVYNPDWVIQHYFEEEKERGLTHEV